MTNLPNLNLKFFQKIILFSLIIIWCAGFLIEFIIPVFNNAAYALPFLDKFYSLVCHQNPHKLITINGYSTLVCARCTGIYFGFLISAAIFIFIVNITEPKIKYFIFAGIPMALDVLLYSIGVYPYSKTIALITGLLLGSVGFIYFYDALKKLYYEIKTKK